MCEREMVLANDIDLLHPPAELEKRKHKLKRLVQSPNSFFMDVKVREDEQERERERERERETTKTMRVARVREEEVERERERVCKECIY